MRNGFKKSKPIDEKKLKPICETVSNRFQKIETERKTDPYEKERSKERDIPLEKEIKERKKEIDKDILSISACACEEDCEELKSHEDIMREWELPLCITKTLKDFLRHCYINGHVVSNAKLDDILGRLFDKFGSRNGIDIKGANDCINTAIRGGFFDIRA